ncbi:MAG: ADOP family duplicated permease [Thermoanaerobaculia bacterium]
MASTLTQAVRRLRRRPALAGTSIVVLGLAIGLATAIFSLLDAVALRPLAYPEPERLVRLGAAVDGQAELQETSWPKFQALVAGSRSTAALAAYYRGSFALTDRQGPEVLTGARVSERFLEVWGVEPLLGRGFSPAEQQPGGAPVALLSYGLWRQRFGGERSILGRTLDLEGVPTTVVGVLPDTLRFPFGDVEIWLPRPDEASFLPRRILDLGAGYLDVAARLRPGVTRARAAAEIDRLAGRYARDFPDHLDTRYRLAMVPMTEFLVGSTRASLFVLLAAVGVVLLVACADVANLQLADGLARRREIAARIALGAGRRRILADEALQSLLLSGLGGALGVAIAFASLRLLVATSPADLPRLAEAGLSGRALLFALAATALAGLLAGLAPAGQTLRTDPRVFLVDGDRGSTAGGGTRWAQGLLVTAQVALALALVSAAGLLVRSWQRVERFDLGFASADLAVVQVTLPEAKYPDLATRRRFFAALVERVRALPGVESAGLVEYPPTVGAPHTTVEVEGVPVAPDERPLVSRLLASPGYLPTLGVRFVAGRDFDPRAAADAPPTAIVTRAFVARVLSGHEPLGARLVLRGGAAPVEIVGVVEDLQQDPVEAGREPLVFLSQPQAGPELFPPNFFHLVVRSPLAPAAMAEALRGAVRELDPGEPLPEVATMSSILAAANGRRRLSTGLFSGFAALALGLCLLGIYGVIAHWISLGRREIGVRMALGARPSRVLLEVLARGARWILPGLVLGAGGALLAGRALAAQLFEIEPLDVGHVVAAAALLALVAFAACLLPAREATRVDPASALRLP